MSRRQRLELVVLLLIGIVPFLLNGFYNPRLADWARWFWLIEVLSWIVLPAAILFVGLRRGLFTMSEIGFTDAIRGRRSPYLVIALAFAVPIALYHLDRAAVIWGLRFWATHPAATGFQYQRMIPPPGPQTGWLRLAALLHLSVTAAIVEEAYYRGMMSRVFARGAAGGPRSSSSRQRSSPPHIGRPAWRACSKR